MKSAVGQHLKLSEIKLKIVNVRVVYLGQVDERLIWSNFGPPSCF